LSFLRHLSAFLRCLLGSTHNKPPIYKDTIERSDLIALKGRQTWAAIVRGCPKNGRPLAQCFFTNMPPGWLARCLRERMGMFKRGVGPLLSVVRPSLDPFLILVRRTHSRRLCRVGRGLILFGEWTSYTPPSRSLPLRGFTTSSANALFISRTARSRKSAKHAARACT